MLGFGSIGEFSIGEFSAGSGNGTGNVTQAAGTGVARGVTPSVGASVQQASGTGVAQGVASNLAVFIVGVSGAGIARAASDQVDKGITGVSGTGVAGSVIPSPMAVIVGVSGVGVARGPSTSIQAFFQGAFGVGVAGQIIASPGGNLTGCSGTGVAGQITVTISGGGGKRLDGEEESRRRDPRLRTGLVPLKKRPAPPKADPEIEALPPFSDPPLVPAIGEPLPSPDAPATAVSIFEQIRRQVLDARDQSDIERLLSTHDEDERDIADIDAMLALID